MARVDLRLKQAVQACILGAFLGCAWGADVPKPQTLWSFPIPTTVDSSPALGRDGTLYFGDWKGRLFALSPQGQCKWSFKAGRDIWSSPAVGSDGTIYFGSRDRHLYAVSPEGEKRWAFLTGAWVDSSPALGKDGTVYFGSWDKIFYALSASGSNLWRFPTGGPIVSSPAIDGEGKIYFGSHDHKFYALRPDGSRAWEFSTGGAILSSPALDGQGGVFFTSVDGFLYALNADGSLRWRLHTGSITQSCPVLGANGNIYVGVNEFLWAVSKQGAKLWTIPAPGWERVVRSSPTVLADDSIYLIPACGELSLVDPKPQFRWHFSLRGNSYTSPAIGPNGTLYIGMEWFQFVALDTHQPLAQSPWPKFRGNPQNTGNVYAQ